MKKTSFYVLTVLTMGTISFGNAQTEKKMENHFTKEQQNVYRVVEKMTADFEKKDIAEVLKAYEKGAIVMFEPQKPISGATNLKVAFEQFAGMNPKFTYYNGHEVYISGNIATHIAPWKMTGQLPDGTKVEQSGLSVAVLRKQDDGGWLMIQDNPNGAFLMNQ